MIVDGLVIRCLLNVAVLCHTGTKGQGKLELGNLFVLERLLNRRPNSPLEMKIGETPVNRLLIFIAAFVGLMLVPATATEISASGVVEYTKSVIKRVTGEPDTYGSGRILAKVDLSSQRMRVYRGKKHLYTWKVSTGRKGYGTPTGTWRIHRMHKRYYSRKYDNAPMPHAMFYYKGFAVHGTYSIKRLGRRASHGCIRLHPDNAARLFSLVKRNGGTVKVVW